MALDEAKLRFKGKLISAAMRKNASVESADAEPFAEALYAEWKATGKGIDAVAVWLDQRLADAFQSAASPPAWVEDQPSWPFFQGKPMVFISQSRVPDTPVSRQALSPGTELYLFGAREPYKSGFKMHYRLVTQHAELKSKD